MIFQRLPVEHETLILAGRVFGFLVEALFRLVAQGFPFEHLVVELWQLQIAALVEGAGRGRPPHTCTGHVRYYVPENIEADHIDGSEGRGARPAKGLACERVDV